MTDSKLQATYNYFKEVVESNTEFCKENGFFEKYGQSDYGRLKAENEMLKLKIEMMKRNLL